MSIQLNPKKTNRLAATIIAITAILVNTTAYAAIGITPAVVINGFDSPNHINSGDTIHASGFGLPDSYSDSIFFNNSAVGLNGNWFTFRNHDTTDVTVSVNGDTNFAPGLSVWATGSAEFNGGTSVFGSEISTAGFDSPFSFNAMGVIGSAGTVWMADANVAAGGGGNVLETLAYAMTGPTHLNSGWGEDLVTGAHDVSLTNTFENGVSGSINTTEHTTSLTFNDLAIGWYTIYVGGTDNVLTGGSYDLTVISAVPEAETWAMLLAGLCLIGWRLKKHQRATHMTVAY